MKKTVLVMGLLLFAATVFSQQSFYDFTVKDINGNNFNLSSLKGKKVLVVNTASKCGFTPQYEGLEKLYETYGGDKFTIIGFPANNFANQEPGTNEDIAAFCEKNYGVSFPMMAKISVKGNDMAPVYQWLTNKNKNGVKDSEVKWNFQKYLIDENGHLVNVLLSKIKPDDQSIVDWIKN